MKNESTTFITIQRGDVQGREQRTDTTRGGVEDASNARFSSGTALAFSTLPSEALGTVSNQEPEQVLQLADSAHTERDKNDGMKETARQTARKKKTREKDG